MNDITQTKSIIPLTHDTFNIGASNNFYNAIYCDVLTCESGTVGGNTLQSDRRLKMDIVDLAEEFGLDFVNRMRPVSYIYKGKSRTHFGVIANELYDLLQTDKYSIWSKLKDGQETQAIQTQEFIGVFIKAIQELHGTVRKQACVVEQQSIKIRAQLENEIAQTLVIEELSQRISRLEEALTKLSFL